MFRSNRVCAIMLFQQGGPGRNPNEYLLWLHPPQNRKSKTHFSNQNPHKVSYFANSEVIFLSFCAPAQKGTHFAGSFDQTLAAILASRAFGKKISQKIRTLRDHMPVLTD